jgi:hypothetical protein
MPRLPARHVPRRPIPVATLAVHTQLRRRSPVAPPVAVHTQLRRRSPVAPPVVPWRPLVRRASPSRVTPPRPPRAAACRSDYTLRWLRATASKTSCSKRASRVGSASWYGSGTRASRWRCARPRPSTRSRGPRAATVTPTTPYPHSLTRTLAVDTLHGTACRYCARPRSRDARESD